MDSIALDHVKHIGFALYGFEPSARPIAEMYEWAKRCLLRLGCTPDKAGANIGGKSDGKYKVFRTLDRKLTEVKFNGVTYWCLVAIPPDLAGEKHGEYFGENAAISYDTQPLNKYLVFHVRDGLVPECIDKLFEAARQCCEQLNPMYGIVYRRPFGCGPSPYGMGMRYNGNFAVDDDNMEYWTTMMQHEAYTLLRSVYPWNLLTQTQLSIKVDKSKLEDWIELKKGRGSLSKFTDQITLWTVPDETLLKVRDELWNAGVILDRKRHFEKVMEEYHVDEDEVAEHYKTGKPLIHRPRGPGISEEEMMKNILGTLGGSESRVFKKEKSGKLRELSDDE